MKQFTVDYFINKFEAIPENKWCIYSFHNHGKSCVNGHCGVEKSVYHKPTKESSELYVLFHQLDKGEDRENFPYSFTAAEINNGGDERYQQPTPKQRILAALYDIKKMQYPELSQTTVEELISENVM